VPAVRNPPLHLQLVGLLLHPPARPLPLPPADDL